MTTVREVIGPSARTPYAWLGAGALMLALAAICAVTYWRIGSHLDPDGTLREPFGFIPLGFLSAFVGAILLVVGFIRRR